NKPRKQDDGQQVSHQLDSCNPKDPRCGNNAICTDRKSKGQFTCECAENAFRFYDGSCRLSAACDVSNDCDKNAVCANVFDSYKCQCRPGYIDLSPDPETRPGRYLINECATKAHDCSPFAECIDATDGYACVCTDGFSDTSSTAGLLPGRKCSN
uniref:EGF-like domain-containing protein n=1 Tax=Panagrolaimus sp. ES5 TaxID=591445 RepID=A0AC34GM51_9BILA